MEKILGNVFFSLNGLWIRASDAEKSIPALQGKENKTNNVTAVWVQLSAIIPNNVVLHRYLEEKNMKKFLSYNRRWRHVLSCSIPI